MAEVQKVRTVRMDQIKARTKVLISLTFLGF